MRRLSACLIVVVVMSASCATDEPAASTTLAASTTTTTLRVTTGPPDATTTTTSSSTTTTTAAATSTTTTTVATACPDLASDDGPDAEAQDVVLAGWREPAGELIWELPLGTRLPMWGVWGDQIVLGFPDGELVGIDVATCAQAWSLSLDPLVDLEVTNDGTTIVSTATEIAGYAGPGFASWRKVVDTPLRFLVEGGETSVLVDTSGNLTGIHTPSGEDLFTWNSSGDFPIVAIDELYVYRALDGVIQARPNRGGDVNWERPIDGLTSMFAATGTLLALTIDTLIALEPQTGEVRWTVPFQAKISPPVVLDHGELHLAQWPTTLWHLDPATGAVVFEGTAPAGTEWLPQMDDGLVLQVGDEGTVTGINLLHNEVWALPTGANRLDTVTDVERARGAIVVSLTFSGERF